jgi:hypothetical protein
LAWRTIERIEPEMGRDRVHHPLDRHHPLRPAEAAEGGVGDGVGLEPARDDLDRGQVIAIVGVEHGAVADREAEVGGGAAARGEGDADALDPALAVEADIIVRREIVALAGHDHVVVAVGADLGRAAGLGDDQSAGGGVGGGLGLLAAEAAAHPPDLDRDVGAAEAEQVGDQMLDLARMLGRADDVDLAPLARRRERGLAFEVEMLLPAHFESSRQAMRGGARARPRHRRAP